METIEILKFNRLSKTASRLDILEVFLDSDKGLSEKEIDEKIDGKYDRATIYRTLKTFREKGLIHPVILENEMTRYVLKKEPENHVHFKCEECGNVFCLTQVKITDPALPAGFIQKGIDFVVTGMCPACN